MHPCINTYVFLRYIVFESNYTNTVIDIMNLIRFAKIKRDILTSLLKYYALYVNDSHCNTFT